MTDRTFWARRGADALRAIDFSALSVEQIMHFALTAESIIAVNPSVKKVANDPLPNLTLVRTS